MPETYPPRCTDPDCPDYGSEDFGEGTCPSDHAGYPAWMRESADVRERIGMVDVDAALGIISTSGTFEVDDPCAPLPPATRGERIRRAFRARYFGHIRLSENRRLTARLDLRSCLFGGSWYPHEIAVRLGPLVITVEEPPF